MLRLPNRVQESAGNQPDAATAYQLSGTAVTGFRSFAAALTDQDKTRVLAEQVDGNGNPSGAWELAEVTFTAGTPDTLASRVLLDSSTQSLIDWSSVGATPRLSVTDSGTDVTALATYAAGHIAGLACDVTTTTNLRVQPGECVVDGVLVRRLTALDVALSGTGSGDPLEADTYRLVYAYNDGGALGVEVSATDPVWDVALNQWTKTGDATRRWIGMYWVGGASDAQLQITTGRMRERRTVVHAVSSAKTLINDVDVTATPVTVSFAAVCPLNRGVRLRCRTLGRRVSGTGSSVVTFYQDSSEDRIVAWWYGYTGTSFNTQTPDLCEFPILDGLYVTSTTGTRVLMDGRGFVLEV